MNSFNKNIWLTLALVNLAIVALLGLTLRSKILFSIPILDFKSVLHAHSHFAFGGWVTLALMALMISELLPASISGKRKYTVLMIATYLCAVAIMVSFLFQGYGLYSISFSTIFIFISYIFAFVFIQDLVRTDVPSIVKLPVIAALSYHVLSSVGPFTLAYIKANKIIDPVLYKDAVYTYLHLQYNGFFTLAVFGLMFTKLYPLLSKISVRRFSIFSRLQVISIIPGMFLSYLWHYPQLWVKLIAIAGSVIMLASGIYFLMLITDLRKVITTLKKPVVQVGILSMFAFFLKTVFQALTIIPSLGSLVFTNRPVIIGFLHLVLLGFVSIYLVAHLIWSGVVAANKPCYYAVIVFCSGVVLNELLLMLQGLEGMFMISSKLFPYMLWAASIWLFIGALMIVRTALMKNKTATITLSFSNNRFSLK